MENYTVTIARQYGSRGREIGKRLAEQLEYKYYDRDLIALAAEKSGYSKEILGEADEKASNSLLYTLALGSSVYAHGIEHINMPLNDKLFIVQSNIIRDIYNNDDGAVIVGRCSDYILTGKENVIRVFVMADFDSRVRTVSVREGITESKAKDMVVKTDKRRSNYCIYYTGKKWGRTENYDLIINSDVTGVDGAVSVIRSCIEAAQSAKKSKGTV